MAGMEIDSPSDLTADFSPRQRIVQRVAQFVVAFHQFNQTPSHLLDFIKDNESSIPDLVNSILPTDEDVADIRKFKKESRGGNQRAKLKELYAESILWLQWMMFRREPLDFLKDMSHRALGQRAVCGAVWGKNDLAYRCRTCEHDPTCAICVPCFQNGNHEDHDYSIMYTGGGCCDCGDETAWKCEGFCSKHKGIRQIQPLSQELASSVGPVLDILLAYCRDKVISAEQQRLARENNSQSDIKKVANELSSAVVTMLLDFCNCSESLLSFISGRICGCPGLLDVLVRSERFLEKEVVKKLHELLLKLLGEPHFKYEFAKVFIEYYPISVKEMRESSDSTREKYPLLSTFSVQIFTVPTLTSRLVREVDLLGVLLRCLTGLFLSCFGEDDRLQVNKWASIYKTTIRLVEDIRYVMSHSEVSIYIAEERPDILSAWIRILSFVQGMDPQKRATTIHTDDDSDNLAAPFVLGCYLENANSVFIEGAYSIAKTKGKNVILNSGNSPTFPSSAEWLTFECLKTIESWMGSESVLRSILLSVDDSSGNSSNASKLRKILFKTWTSGSGDNGTTLSRVDTDGSDPMDVSDNKDMYPESSCTGELLDSSRGLITFKLLNSVNWPNIEFDVSKQEISFHIPLHRLLSFLLRKALRTSCGEIVNLGTANNIFTLVSSTEHEVFGQVLKGVHPCGFSAYIMENPLRLRVFCAQVRAGMWRKNGDAAILSCEWYRSVQWLEIGLETDLFLLQCCAALAPPELFFKRIQERFGLTDYTSLNLADHNEYEPVLAQEMLTLIIQIIEERRFCGLTIIENLRRELVYKLAIGDATRSQLVKALPGDLSKCDQLQNVLDTLADYSKPSGMKQGKYSLRKAFWKELDLYHPRWNSRDLQVAEERYFRFCKTSARNAQVPQWRPIYNPLTTVSRIATSKSILQFIRAIIFYAVFTEISSLSRVPDGVLITALHLLSLGLDIYEKQLPHNVSNQADDLFPILTYACEEFDAGDADEVFWKNQSLISLLVSLMRKYKGENNYSYSEARQCNISSLVENLLKKFAQLSPRCMDNLKRLAPDVICQMPHHSFNNEEQNLASTSDMEERRAKARERQAAIMEKMRAEQSKFIASLESEANGEPDTRRSDQKVSISEIDHTSQESAPVCSLCRGLDFDSPMCFLILLQKSRLTSFVDRGPVSWDGVDQSNKEIHPIKKKGVIEPKVDDLNIPLPSIQSADLDVSHDRETSEFHSRKIQSLGEWFPESRKAHSLNASSYGSPLTLEMLESEVYSSIRHEIYATQCQSNALDGETRYSTSQVAGDSQLSKSATSYVLGGSVASLSIKTSKLANFPSSTVTTPRVSEFGPRDCDGIHLSSCGHAVHQECHNRYLTSLKQRHLRKISFEGGHIVDPDLGEMLCPVCRRFSNSIMPSPGVSNGALMDISLNSLDANKNNNLRLPLALSLLQCTTKIVGQSKFWNVSSFKQNVTIGPALEPVIRKLCELYSSHSYDNLSASERLIQSLILWNTFTYSLVSTEIASREMVKTYSMGSLSLEALYGQLHSSNGFILSLLLHIGHISRISSHLDVLFRFKGVQLLAGSICSGVSEDRSSNSDKKRGTLSSILEHPDKGEGFPDSQFYKQAADPILAHDPFSSLMRVLYCLPSPFVSSSEFLFSLIHLFYCVCVVQGLITCYSSRSLDLSCFGDCALNVMCKIMGESEFVRQYFVSSYIDVSSHPKDMIRRFTLPYLRRCALLWKMLQSSTPTPLYIDSSLVMGSNSYLKSSGYSAKITELRGVKELEGMFQIYSLELVLNNEIMESLALKWCHHFCDEFRVHNYGTALYSTPAVPFKLMHLPRLYQDLLERYIKLHCSGCKSVPEEPALCLLCGRLCSPRWKSCCRESGCQNHAKVCGAGIGVFLLVRRTIVLLLRSNRQASWPSPYLDAFGEEDHDVYRGKPLYLCEERYAALTYLVASHSLDQTSEVLRKTFVSLDSSE